VKQIYWGTVIVIMLGMLNEGILLLELSFFLPTVQSLGSQWSKKWWHNQVVKLNTLLLQVLLVKLCGSLGYLLR
jgi:hypothetical protein